MQSKEQLRALKAQKVAAQESAGTAAAAVAAAVPAPASATAERSAASMPPPPPRAKPAKSASYNADSQGTLLHEENYASALHGEPSVNQALATLRSSRASGVGRGGGAELNSDGVSAMDSSPLPRVPSGDMLPPAAPVASGEGSTGAVAGAPFAAAGNQAATSTARSTHSVGSAGPAHSAAFPEDDTSVLRTGGALAPRYEGLSSASSARPPAAAEGAGGRPSDDAAGEQQGGMLPKGEEEGGGRGGGRNGDNT
jgi:hypothetical protein